VITTLLVAALAMAVIHFAISAIATSTVASQKVSFEGRDVVTVADADAYSKALDVRLSAQTTATAATATMLAQREAFDRAATMADIAAMADKAFRAALVAAASLMTLAAVRIARRRDALAR
jgi:hypothetical protein